ncbi:MAG: endospore germination permease [Clostridia bacterium]|nr:endospore germination permease [Clostridia bacterium]
MEKEILSQKQGIVLMITFTLGSSLVLGTGGHAKQDSWIAILLSMVLALPVFLVYSRLLMLYPGKDILFIFEDALGKLLGKAAIAVYTWYAFHLGALVIRNFIEFINIVSLPETPKYIIGLCMTIVCIIGVKCGIEVLGRWTLLILPVILFSIFLVTLLAAPVMHLENLKPILGNGLGPVIKNAFYVFSFPFAETVLFLFVLGSLRLNSSPRKVYMTCLLASGFIMLLVSVRSIIVLGVPTVDVTYFSSYAAVSLVKIGNFLQRIEVTVAVVFLLAGFVKICICLLVACRGFCSLIKLKDYRGMVAPVGLLMLILALTVYQNTIQMFTWVDIYTYYAIPFQIILPAGILVAAEIKRRKRNHAANRNTQQEP